MQWGGGGWQHFKNSPPRIYCNLNNRDCSQNIAGVLGLECAWRISSNDIFLIIFSTFQLNLQNVAKSWLIDRWYDIIIILVQWPVSLLQRYVKIWGFIKKFLVRFRWHLVSVDWHFIFCQIEIPSVLVDQPWFKPSLKAPL